jgi:hypothetical protein
MMTLFYTEQRKAFDLFLVYFLLIPHPFVPLASTRTSEPLFTRAIAEEQSGARQERKGACVG